MDASDRFKQVQLRLAPLREELINHRIYGQVRSLPALRIFMRHHVFAVWDFMSLLKALQRRLSCVEVPWVPAADLASARFVNEIVLAEESDEDGEGGYASHCTLYHRAMEQCGADTRGIDHFLEQIRGGASVTGALANADPGVPVPVQAFVRHTFAVIASGDLCAIAAAFTFGREDLLPDVFQRIVDELNAEARGGLGGLLFYLNRHIELDGGHHGPMAARLMASLCGEDDEKWGIAEGAAVESLRARKALWDGVLSAM